MSREIKFRAWSPDNKEMYYADADYSFRVYNNSISYRPHYESDELEYYSTDPGDGEKKIEVMEYTGFKDGKGKEIYEGDIMDFGSNRVFYISYVGCQFVATFSERVINMMIPIYNFEIVGNIYQNPELIETAAKV